MNSASWKSVLRLLCADGMVDRESFDLQDIRFPFQVLPRVATTQPCRLAASPYKSENSLHLSGGERMVSPPSSPQQTTPTVKMTSCSPTDLAFKRKCVPFCGRPPTSVPHCIVQVPSSRVSTINRPSTRILPPASTHGRRARQRVAHAGSITGRLLLNVHGRQ